LELLFLSF